LGAHVDQTEARNAAPKFDILSEGLKLLYQRPDHRSKWHESLVHAEVLPSMSELANILAVVE
jgi:hypothetical protein